MSLGWGMPWGSSWGGTFVTVDEPVQIGRRTYRITWSSTNSAPRYYIFKGGDLWQVTDIEELILGIEPGDSMPLTITDCPQIVAPVRFDGRLDLRWRATDGTEHYRIEEFIAAAWTLVRKIRDQGEVAFRHRTRYLEDDQTHMFRVIAVGDNQNQSPATLLTVLMVRNPDIPNVSYAFNTGPSTLTITEN